MEEASQKIGTIITKLSFKDLFYDNDITDIYYNGDSIFYLSNTYGRKKFEKPINKNEVYNFLRDICDITDTPFSLTEPILDVSFLEYRLNAVYRNICRKNRTNCITFAIRKFKINHNPIDNDNNFISEDGKKFLQFMINRKSSILIAGPTGSGKTQLQKYLINLLNKNERIIVIDTINELDIQYNKNLDITCLIEDSKRNIYLRDLVKLALRYSPDYIVLAEARGSEFEDVLTSSLSGISNITTIHSKSVDTILNRCVNLIQINNKNLNEDVINKMILTHFDLFIYVDKKEINSKIIRYVSSIKQLYNEKLFEIYNDENKNIHNLQGFFKKEYDDFKLKYEL